MLNGLRNILTALWCAVLLAGFGYPLIAALRTSGVNGLDMATIASLPIEMIVSVLYLWCLRLPLVLLPC